MSSVIIGGDTSGSIPLSAPAVAGSSVLTLPVATDTLVGKATTDTLTNKSIAATQLTGQLPLTQLTDKIQPITASVASNALTVTLNPTVLDFRASPITSGTVTTITVASAISVVIPSTSTMGTVSAVQSRIVVIAINNAGTVELAAVNISGGSVLDETTLINTTAAAAAGNSATAYYSTTARTGVAYRVVGYVESTQATAGTWATAPSTIQGMGGQAVSAMSSLGYGQTWQTVTRTTGVTYYNTTGKPILLTIWGYSAQPSSYTITVNTIQVASGAISSSYGNQNMMTAIIPPSNTYVVTGTGGYNSTELR